MAVSTQQQQTDATLVARAMDEVYKLHPAKAQWSRLGKTTKFFKPRYVAMQGESSHFKVFTEPLTAARRYKPVTDETVQWPRARKLDYVDVSYGWTDMAEFRSTVEFTGLAARKTATKAHSVYRAAAKLVASVNGDYAHQLNTALHQNVDCVMALVAATYDIDGTSYTGGSTDCFIQIDRNQS